MRAGRGIYAKDSGNLATGPGTSGADSERPESWSTDGAATKVRPHVRLYLMRHGPAEDVADTGRDFDRVLTPSGRTRVQRVAELLLAEGEAPNALQTSPLLRTQETAAIVASVCKLPEPTIAERLAPGHDARGFLDRLVTRAGLEDRIMIVGHEPDMSELTDYVLRRDARGEQVGFGGFEKAMVVVFEIAGEKRTLVHTLDPRTLSLR